MVELPFLELLPELKCPICLEILTETMTTKECLHRFCSDCITKSLQLVSRPVLTCPTPRLLQRASRNGMPPCAVSTAFAPSHRLFLPLHISQNMRSLM